MVNNKYITSDYEIIVTKSRGKSVQNYTYKIEIQIIDILINFFDYNTVIKITNTIYSNLFPNLSFQNSGFTTKIEVEVINASLCTKNNGILYGYVKRIDCRHNEEKVVMHFNIEIELFTKNGAVARSRMEVYRTKDSK